MKTHWLSIVMLVCPLSGCVDLAGGLGSSVPEYQYNPSTGGYVPVAEAAYYDQPLYSFGSVNYYYVSGRYMYDDGYGPIYVDRLPDGGYYNRSHPVYPCRTSPSIIYARSQPISSAPVLSVTNKVVVNKTYVQQTNITQNNYGSTGSPVLSSKAGTLSPSKPVVSPVSTADRRGVGAPPNVTPSSRWGFLSKTSNGGPVSPYGSATGSRPESKLGPSSGTTWQPGVLGGGKPSPAATGGFAQKNELAVGSSARTLPSPTPGTSRSLLPAPASSPSIQRRETAGSPFGRTSPSPSIGAPRPTAGTPSAPTSRPAPSAPAAAPKKKVPGAKSEQP